MSINRIFAVVFSFLLVVSYFSCANQPVTMPNYNVLNSNHRLTSAPVAGHNDVAWGKLTLDDCLKIALENHPRLKIYQTRINQRQESYNSAKALDYPVLSLSTSYDRLSYVSPVKRQFLGDSNNDYQASLNIESPIFTGGRITAEKEQARYSLNGAREDYRGVELEVIHGVKLVYYKLSIAEEMIAIRQDLSAKLNDFWGIAKELNQLMKTPREEVLLRIEVQLNNAEQELINAQTNVKILKELLFNAMGISPGGQTQMEIQAINIVRQLPDALSEENMDLDMSNNPDLLRLEQELKRARESVTLAQSEYSPQIKLRGSYGYEWATLPPERDTWSFGVVINLPLWDWGRINSKVKQATAYLEEINATKEFAEQKVSLEVKSTYLDYQSSKQRAKIAYDSLAKASKSLSLFEQRYKDNTVASLDVLDAYQSYATARSNYAQAVLSMYLSQATLERLLGKQNEHK